MRTDIPCHNDLWTSNLVLQDETEKLYICDWEYATMGDPLFELAYFIESANLSNEQEKVFLDAYGEYDELFLIRHKMLSKLFSYFVSSTHKMKSHFQQKCMKKDFTNMIKN